MVHSFSGYSDFMHEITVHTEECSGRNKVVRLSLRLYATLLYRATFSKLHI